MMFAKPRIIAMAVLLGAALDGLAAGPGAVGQDKRPAPPAASAPSSLEHRSTTMKLSKDLNSGGRILPGDSLFSPLGGFRLTLQDDGNLVFYAIDDMRLPVDVLRVSSRTPDVLKLYTKPIWSTGTHVPRAGRGLGALCAMEENGNLVVYDRDRHVCFETETAGHPGAFLRCQDDGNLVIYSPDVQAVWQSITHARLSDRSEPFRGRAGRGGVMHQIRGLPARLSKDLQPRWRLNPGDSLFSALGGFKLIMQDDGNLVLYAIDATQLPPDISSVVFHARETLSMYTNPIWSSGTNVPTEAAGAGAYCIMNDDGNFVIYDDDKNPCFQSSTPGNPRSFLRCQDDGNLVIYTPEKKAIWQSKTYARMIDRRGKENHQVEPPQADPNTPAPSRR